MTTPPVTQLDVFFGEEVVGAIYDTAPLSFEYSDEWLGRSEPAQIASIGLSKGRHQSDVVEAFFENLLPEGELRNYIAASAKASTLFSLLLEVAGDTAGGFVILPAKQRPQAPSYEPTSWQALGAKLRQKSATAVDIKSRQARISLAGAQDKASIAIFEDGMPQLPRGTSPSTHILKPDIKRLTKVWHSAANETIIMLAATRCGLPTADVFYEPHTQSCVVRRFDRMMRPDGTLGRIIQYDLCQLSGIVSEKKYEKEGGPGAVQCAQMIRRYSAAPAIDLKLLLGWIFFNLYTGNNDSHAKNLSLYRVPGNGVRLTPFYDLMCTRIYPGLSQEFAFSIGGEVMPGAINQTHVQQMAKEMGIRPAFALGIAREMAKKVPDAVDAAVALVLPDLAPGAKTLALRLQRFVLQTTRQIAKRILAG